MTGKALVPLLLASAAAHADRAWVFEPGQALVSVEMGPAHARVAATSLGMSGRVRELDSGAVQAEVHVTLASFVTGSSQRDQQLRQNGEASAYPEIVFRGTAPGAGDDGTLHLKGTLTIHGTSRTLEVPVAVVRAGGMAFGHATLALHLSDFGLPVLPGVPDEVRVELDAGLKPENAAVATRG